MKIIDIYRKYCIPPNLARHQFEVSSVGRFICDHWQGSPVDKSIVTQALLLHDMGNIIKFRRPFLGELEQDSKYWEQVQLDFFTRYGKDVHTATVEIVREIGVDEKVFRAVEALDGSYLEQFGYPSNEVRISNYADMCVTPEGIVGFERRMQDLRKRYSKEDNDWQERRRRENAKFIQENVNIDLALLAENDFSASFLELKEYQIVSSLK